MEEQTVFGRVPASLQGTGTRSRRHKRHPTSYGLLQCSAKNDREELRKVGKEEGREEGRKGGKEKMRKGGRKDVRKVGRKGGSEEGSEEVRK